MSKALMIRSPQGLSLDLSDERAREILKGVAIGTALEVEIRRPRNLQFHRLFWALCTTIAESVPGFRSSQEVCDVLKIATGHYTTVRGKTDIYRLPKSISFAAMQEPEFRAFFDKCCQVICEGWIAHMNPGALRDDIMRMVGVPVESEAA